MINIDERVRTVYQSNIQLRLYTAQPCQFTEGISSYILSILRLLSILFLEVSNRQ